MLRRTARHLPGFLVGATAAAATGLALRRLDRVAANVSAGSGLVAAAAIYPAMRRSFHTPGVGTEALVLATAIGMATAAARADNDTGRRLLAGT